jgi:hypothetical protein
MKKYIKQLAVDDPRLNQVSRPSGTVRSFDNFLNLTPVRNILVVKRDKSLGNSDREIRSFLKRI